MVEVSPGDRVRIVTEKIKHPQALLGEEYLVQAVGEFILWIKVPNRDNYIIEKSQVVRA